MIHVYTWSNLDGILFCLWPKPGGVSEKKRLFVGGDPDIRSLTEIQLRAVLCLLTKQAKFKARAIFYSGNDYRDQGCPDGIRGKILLTLKS